MDSLSHALLKVTPRSAVLGRKFTLQNSFFFFFFLFKHTISEIAAFRTACDAPFSSYDPRRRLSGEDRQQTGSSTEAARRCLMHTGCKPEQLASLARRWTHRWSHRWGWTRSASLRVLFWCVCTPALTQQHLDWAAVR